MSTHDPLAVVMVACDKLMKDLKLSGPELSHFLHQASEILAVQPQPVPEGSVESLARVFDKWLDEPGGLPRVATAIRLSSSEEYAHVKLQAFELALRWRRPSRRLEE